MDDRRPNSDEPTESKVEPRPDDPKPETTDPGSNTPGERRRRGNRHHAYRRKNRARQGERARSGQEKAPTSAEMRGARASGRTPGSTTAEEPAAAPLGTDDEAAGTPPRGDVLQHEVDRAEEGRGMQGLTADEAMSGRPGHPEESARGFGKAVTIGAAIVILIVLAIVLF